MRFGLSCGQLGSDVVLVDESAKDLFPVDPVLGEVDRLRWAGRCLGWGELAEGAMRPVLWGSSRCGDSHFRVSAVQRLMLRSY
jgi:hypothetical protein